MKSDDDADPFISGDRLEYDDADGRSEKNVFGGSRKVKRSVVLRETAGTEDDTTDTVGQGTPTLDNPTLDNPTKRAAEADDGEDNDDGAHDSPDASPNPTPDPDHSSEETGGTGSVVLPEADGVIAAKPKKKKKKKSKKGNKAVAPESPPVEKRVAAPTVAPVDKDGQPCVRLNVRGERFYVARAKLVAVEGSLFQVELGGVIAKASPKQEIQIDRDPKHAGLILQWLQSRGDDGSVSPKPPYANKTFRAEMEYFRVSLAMTDQAVIYVVGGWCAKEPRGPAKEERRKAGVTHTVDCFNTKDGTWEAGDPMPGKRSFHSATVLDGTVYVAGGCTSDGPDGQSDGAAKSATQEKGKEKEKEKEKEKARGEKEVAVKAGGGRGDDGSASASVCTYSPLQRTWVQCASLSVPRQGVAMVTLGRCIYAIGGFGDDNKCQSRVERFDPKSNAWCMVRPLPAPRSSAATAALDGSIYVVGGWDGKKCVATTLRYATKIDQWHRLAPLPGPCYGLTCVAAGGSLYAIGGGSVDGVPRYDDKGKKMRTNKVSALSSVYKYDTEADTWHTLPPMETARMCAGCVFFRGKIYVLGGQQSDKKPLDTVEILDLGT